MKKIIKETKEATKKVVMKCIHTFKCMFNAGSKECVATAKAELMKESKKTLEEIGRYHGIELDRRKNKKELVDELYEVM